MILKVFFVITFSFSLATVMSQFLVQHVQDALKFHQAGDIAAALPLYEKALSEKESLNSNIISTLASNVGSIYMSLGEYEKAAVKFETAIEATPDKVESHYNYAVVLNSKLGDNGKALKHCAMAIKLDPSFYKTYHLMGNIMQDLGRPEKADDYFVKAETIAQSLGLAVEEQTLSRPRKQADFKLNSIWMFQKPQVNASYDIPVPLSMQEKIGRSVMTVICLSKQPLIFEIPLFLSAEECEHIKVTATPKLELSHVMGSKVNPSGDDSTSDASEPYRSSYNAWLPLDPVLISLQERISLATSLPLQYISLKSEELQVVKYEAGGQFKMHHDSSGFNPRLLTALVYLQDSSSTYDVTDVEVDGSHDSTIYKHESCLAGGETIFPFAASEETSFEGVRSVDDALSQLSQLPQETLKRKGIAVPPVQGKAIIFFNHRADGSIDPLAVHSGSKLDKGTKWVANYWVELDMDALNSMPVGEEMK